MWWCTPVVSALWEAKAGGSKIQTQPQQFSDSAIAYVKVKNKRRAGNVAQCYPQFWEKPIKGNKGASTSEITGLRMPC